MPVLSLCALLLLAPDSAPLPDAEQLRQKALSRRRAAAQALERYSCIIESQSQTLDDSGRVKKTESERVERFFVNGVQIDHTVARNGKELTGGEAKKEQARVDKEVRKYSDSAQAKKFRDRGEKRIDMFMRAQRFLNGRREQQDGRSTLIYDLASDEKFRPGNLEERFAKAVSGRIRIDEESGMPIELRIETTRDVKMGGGLLANLHKGFQLHLVSARQADGLWLAKLIEGTADLRAGLFFHPRVRFRELNVGCRLFSVDSKDVLHGTPENPR